MRKTRHAALKNRSKTTQKKLPAVPNPPVQSMASLGKDKHKSRPVESSKVESPKHARSKKTPGLNRPNLSVEDDASAKIQHLRRTHVIELAIEHFKGYARSGHKIDYEELGEFAQKKWGFTPAPATIGRRITKAFQDQWVEVAPAAENNARPPKPKFDTNMAKELKQKFGRYGLQSALVLDTDELPESYAARPDDPFYQLLGQVMADHLADQFIRPEDVVGIGSGRACYNVVKFLKPLNIAGLKLMSLTGRVWSRPDPARRMESWMDSDFHLGLFLNQCVSAEPFFIGHPLTFPAMYIASKTPPFDIDILVEEARKNTLLGKDRWTVLHPTVAILGCGTVLKDHRFWVGRESQKKDFDPLLQPVFEDLKRLVSLFEDEVTKDYSPVADTSNHLFFVPHPDKAVRAKFRFKEDDIKRTIGEINKKLLSVTDIQFPDIHAIALTAGTAEKAFGIRELLVNSTYKVTVLCTDRTAGEKLLAMPI